MYNDSPVILERSDIQDIIEDYLRYNVEISLQKLGDELELTLSFGNSKIRSYVNLSE